jgi:hypothetical protein
MGLKIVYENGLFCPQVFCDLCGEQITKATNGNFEWLVDEKTAEPSTGYIYFTHKKCSDGFRKNSKYVRTTWFCDELEMLPFMLKNNLRIDKKHANETAKLLSMLE